MSVLGEMLGSTVPHEFTHRGRTYKVSLLNQKVKAAFERKAFSKAKEAAAEMRECMTADEYQSHLFRLNEDYISGEYSLESQDSRAVKFLNTNPGKVALCALLFGTDEMDIIKIMSERPAEVTALLDLVTKESFPKAAEGEGPND